MEALGAALAAGLGAGGLLVTLAGELGSGKTTLVRGLLRAVGVEGVIRSPTYTLVEPYAAGGRDVYHLDLYRIADPGELELIGIRDLLAHDALVLVEWPERGAGALPTPDLALTLAHAPEGRTIALAPASAPAAAVLASLTLPPGVTAP